MLIGRRKTSGKALGKHYNIATIQSTGNSVTGTVQPVILTQCFTKTNLNFTVGQTANMSHFSFTKIKITTTGINGKTEIKKPFFHDNNVHN